MYNSEQFVNIYIILLLFTESDFGKKDLIKIINKKQKYTIKENRHDE